MDDLLAKSDSRAKYRPSRLRPAITGLVMAALGLLIMAMLSQQASERTPARRAASDWLFMLVPIVTLAGIVILIRGLVWGSRVFTRRTVLITGIAALLIGGCPWPWTPLLIHDRGGEGSGMLGTLLFLMVGVPGLLLMLIGLALRGWRSAESS